MEPRAKGKNQRVQTGRSLFLVGILLLALFPALTIPAVSAGGARDASIMLSVSPSSQTVNPGESGEYTVTVYNMGSEPVSVSLQSNEAQTQECNDYSSTITQIPGVIEAGESGEATMNVTLTQNAADECETTVRATANEQATPPGQPDTQESTVTTKSGDGESSPLYGVDLKTDQPSKNWNGEQTVIFDVEVENTGRVNETIVLTLEENDAPGCDISDLTADVDPSTVQLDNDSSEMVEVQVDVPTGHSASKHCWNLHAQVQNDPSQNSSDDLELDLSIPEIHDCTATLTSAIVNVAPGAMAPTSVTFDNDGNTEFTIAAAKTGPNSGWVSFDGPSSGLLPYDDGEGQKTFDLEISPDDSVDAGSEHLIMVEGRDGSGGPMLCSAELRIIVGQSHAASISLSAGYIPNVEPGSNGSVTVTVSNDGNGQDTLRITTSAPPAGWGISLSSSTVSVGSKHGSQRTASVELVANAPLNALADEAVQVTISVSPNNGGVAYASINLSITVKPIHEWELSEVDVGDQTGRRGTEVHFPITVFNDGNVADTFRFSVIDQTAFNYSDPNDPQRWSTHFLQGSTPVVEIDIPAFTQVTVDLVVRIDGEEELDSDRITVRVTNKDDSNTGDDDADGIPDNQREKQFRAIMSNRNYGMSVSIDEAWSYQNGEPGAIQLVLSPGGEIEVPLWIENTGDSFDQASISMSGLEGLGTRSITIDGYNIAQSSYIIDVPKAMGVWDKVTQTFLKDGNYPVIQNLSSRCDSACAQNEIEQWIITNGDLDLHEARVFKVLATLHINIGEGADNNDAGIARVVVISTHNAANQSIADVPVVVQTIRKVGLTISAGDEMNISYPQNARFNVTLSNEGNIRSEVRVFASEGLRGWVVSLEVNDEYQHLCTEDEGLELFCTLDVGEEMTVFAVVKSPHGIEIADDFGFTLSAEPTEVGLVERENVELEVHGAPGADGFGLSFLSSPAGLSSIAVIAIIILLYVVVEPRRRKWETAKAAMPMYEQDLEALPVQKSGAKRFRMDSVGIVLSSAEKETTASFTADTKAGTEVGFASRSKGKGKRDIFVHADDTRSKLQLHAMHRSAKKKIFDVMDSVNNSPLCVIKKEKGSWSILRVDGSRWLTMSKLKVTWAMGRVKSKRWSITGLEGENTYGQMVKVNNPDGSTSYSVERFTDALDGRAMWLICLAQLLD